MKIVEILGTQYNVVPDHMGGCSLCAFYTEAKGCGAVDDVPTRASVDLAEKEVGACTDNPPHHYEVAACH